MISKKRLIPFCVFFAFSVCFFVLGLNAEFSYNLLENLLRMELNTERWLPKIGSLLFILSFLSLIAGFCILFFEKLVLLYGKHNILFYAIAFFIIALLCRVTCFEFESGDYVSCLKP